MLKVAQVSFVGIIFSAVIVAFTSLNILLMTYTLIVSLFAIIYYKQNDYLYVPSSPHE